MGTLLSRILIIIAKAFFPCPPRTFTTLHDPLLRPPADPRTIMSPVSDTRPPALGLHNHAQTTGSARTSFESPRPPPAHLRPQTPSSVHSSSSEFGDADIIPRYNPAAPRTLVLCFDGTGDQFDSDVRTSYPSPHRALGGGGGARPLPLCDADRARAELKRRQVLQPAQARRPPRADGVLPGAWRRPRECTIAIVTHGGAPPRLLYADWHRDLHEPTTCHAPRGGDVEDP